MFETVDKLFLAGLGALSMTKQKAEQIFDDYVRRGQEVHTNRERFIDNLMDAASRTRKEVQDLIDKQVQQTTAKLNLASKEDLARVEAKLDALLQRGQ